ncbi:hypothetical protein BH23BAC1_BH23BAC1_20480 [soil metagenome]
MSLLEDKVDILTINPRNETFVAKSNETIPNENSSSLNPDFQDVRLPSPSIEYGKQLSDYSIGGYGVLEEVWRIENIPAQLVEVTETHVILDCLVDTDRMIYQERKFPIDLLAEKIEFKSEGLILIRKFKRTGCIKFEFLNGNGMFPDHYFNVKYFQGLKGSAIDKPL